MTTKAEAPGAQPVPALFFAKVERRYVQGAGALEILRGADLAIWPGELVALVAPSGAGKSTLLHLAGLLERPDGGEIYIGGSPTASPSFWTLRKYFWAWLRICSRVVLVLQRGTACPSASTKHTHASFDQEVRIRYLDGCLGADMLLDLLPVAAKPEGEKIMTIKSISCSY